MLPEKTYPEIKTIQDLIEGRLWLRVHCAGCGKTTEIPPALVPRMGLSAHLSLAAAATKFKCTSCNSMSAAVSPVNPLDNW